MPKDFLRCVEKGGRVVTIKPKSDVYIKVCYLKGKAYHGEVHHNKPDKDTKKARVFKKLK